MATYLILANFTEQGIRNIKDTVKRVETFRAASKKAGANVKDFYWTLGQYDCALVIEAPDDATITSLALSVGTLGNVRTQVLRAFTEEEIVPILSRMAQLNRVTQRVSKDFAQIEWDAAIEDDLRQLVRLAVREDLDRQHDWTTVALVSSDREGQAAIAREPGVLAGLRALPIIIDEMQAALELRPLQKDGDEVAAGAVVAELAGQARDLLTCERPLLNLLGRLSGIATRTRAFVHRVADTAAHIYDTRKTTPGWRRMEKYAVRCGGGHNHRTGLFDAILIKDNHLALAAETGLSPADAVRTAREFVNRLSPAEFPNVDSERLLIEVELDRLSQLDDVLAAGPNIVLLDNMSLELLCQAVARRNQLAPHIELEASGGVSLETVREIALTGVERISSGSLTHSAQSLDIALDWLPHDGG